MIRRLDHHPDLATGARNRLADVLGLDSGELLGVLLDHRCQTAQQSRAILRRDDTPRGEGRLGPRDGGVGLLDARPLELGDRLLGRGIDNREGHEPDCSAR